MSTAMTTDIEERVAMLEDEVAQLKLISNSLRGKDKQGWESILGVFADDEYFEEAVRLGAEYRASQKSDER